MHGPLQPEHLFFIILIILVLFGPGKLPEIGRGLDRRILDLRGIPSGFKNALFMAKGVDPSVGRDVGDMLPDEHLKRHETLFLCLLAILIGNTIYFLMLPALPASACMDMGLRSGLPVLVDLWICFLVFGFLHLLRLIHKKRENDPRRGAPRRRP